MLTLTENAINAVKGLITETPDAMRRNHSLMTPSSRWKAFRYSLIRAARPC